MRAEPRPGAATAVAHPNIALVKYWGKRDEDLVVPHTDSLSLTLDTFPTTTTVRLDPSARADRATLDGAPLAGAAGSRVTAFLDLVRGLAGRGERAVVESVNSAPTAAGLASSASGFAALAVAGAAAYGLDLDTPALSRLARRGSGSACRSLHGGFAVWHAGTGTGATADRTSYAEPITDARLDPALVIAVVDTAAKGLSSRAAMRRTVRTSPLFAAWAESCRADLVELRAALVRGDLDGVGSVAERNALGMHATMLAARPAVRYLSQASLTVLDAVSRLRDDGVSAYATIDAGPNVKVLCGRAGADTVAAAVRHAVPDATVVIAGAGPGARLVAQDRP